MSVIDVVKAVLIDPSLEMENVREIFKGIVGMPSNPLTNEILGLSEEETKLLIAELLTICWEVDQPQLITPVNEMLIASLSFQEADTYHSEMLFNNPSLREEVLTCVIRSDPSVSIADVLLGLLKSNLLGSRQYAFERIRNFVREPYLHRNSLGGLVQLAADSGDEEGYGFLKSVLVERYQAAAPEAVNVSPIEYRALLEEECRQLFDYETRLKNLLELRPVDVEHLPNHQKFSILRLLSKISGMEELDNRAFSDLVREGAIGIRHIRYVELLNWIETNELFLRFYGPYNPERIVRSSVFGKDVSQLPEFPEDPRENFMLYSHPDNQDWYSGICEHCLRPVVPRQSAFRRPLADGGWEGCFCSSTCALRDMLYTKYQVPRDRVDDTIDLVERQLKAFFQDINVQYYNGLSLMIRDFPVYQTDDEGGFHDRSGLRHPKIVVVPSREEARPRNAFDEEESSARELGEEVLRELGLDAEDFGLFRDEGERITHTKEVVMEREHLESYALTTLMSARLEGIRLVVPHPR